MARCQECSYDFESLDRAEIIRAVLSLADEHRILLTFVPPERLRDHSRPASWSALEYACHVRDVLRFQRERVALAQTEDTPRFVSMGRDERAVTERYNDQDPAVVASEITEAARQFTASAPGARRGRLDAHGHRTRGRRPRCTPWSGSAAGRRTNWRITCSTIAVC